MAEAAAKAKIIADALKVKEIEEAAEANRIA